MSRKANQLFKKISPHITIWLIVAIYFFAAPRIIDSYFTKVGNPTKTPLEDTRQANAINYSVDRLDLISVDNQKVYNLWGWSFIDSQENQQDFDRYLVLISEHNTYTYKMERYYRPAIQAAFPDILFDITNCGFETYISKGTLPLGNYQVGILYINQHTGSSSLQLTYAHLKRTQNQLFLEKPQ